VRARPLKGAIQQHVEYPLAQAFLAGEFAPGDTIRVEAKSGELVFEHSLHEEGAPDTHVVA